MYTSHQRPSNSYPHHTRYPQHTNTPTPITPDALSTQAHLPHHTRSIQHTNTPTPITPDALMRYTTIATSITPDTLLQLTTLHQISSLSRDPQLPTSHQITTPNLYVSVRLETYGNTVLIVLGNFLCISLSRKDTKTCSKFS